MSRSTSEALETMPGPTLVNWLMFVSSYAVLFAALALRFSDFWPRITCAVIAIGSVLVLRSVIAVQKRFSSFEVEITEVEDRGPDVSGYLAVYLLPLLVIPQPSAFDLAANALVFYAFGTIYVNSRMLQINPTLYLPGFRKRVAMITTKGNLRGFLITSALPAPGQVVRIVQRGDVFFAI